jgi:hypothetical protein
MPQRGAWRNAGRASTFQDARAGVEAGTPRHGKAGDVAIRGTQAGPRPFFERWHRLCFPLCLDALR